MLLAFGFMSCDPATAERLKNQKDDKYVDNEFYKEMEISVFTIQENEEEPPADNKIYKWINDEFGVSFKWDVHPKPGTRNSSIDELIAKGTDALPDMVEVDSSKFQSNGCLIDLMPLIEKYCPNIKTHYKEVWDKMVYIDSEKDAFGNVTVQHVYSIPNYGVISGIDAGTYYNQNAFWIRKEVLKESGFPKIKTIDEYFDVLKEYAEKHPTINGKPTIPFTIKADAWEAFNLWNPPAFLAGYPNDGNGHVDKIDGKYIYKDNFTDKNAEKWYRIANKYYNEGLFDTEFGTDNSNQFNAKIADDRVLGVFIQGWEFSGNDMGDFAPLPVVFDKTVTPYYRDRTLPNLQRGWGITVKAGEEKAIDILKFFDAMLYPANSKVFEWGIEGEDYLIDTKGTKTGIKGAPYRTEDQRKNANNLEWKSHNKATLLHEEMPKWEGSYPDGFFTTMDSLPWEYNLSQDSIDIEIFKAYDVNSYAQLMDKDPPKNPVWYPMWQFNPDAEKGGAETEAAYAMWGFEDVLRESVPELISCAPEEFNAKWEAYKEEISQYTDVYDEFMQQQLDNLISIYTF